MVENLSLLNLGLSLAAGSLTTLSPCVFPILPLVLGGSVRANRLAPIAMGSGMAVTFSLIGLLLGLFGSALGIDTETVRRFAAVLLVAFSAILLTPALNGRFGAWMMPIATRANAASDHLKGESLSSAFLLGGLLGLVWSPCSGPLLGAALTLVASEGGAARGALVLGLFGIGAALPLIAVAYASRNALSRARGWLLARQHTLRTAFALLIGLAGVAILSGGDRWLEARVLDHLPERWNTLSTLL